jgi:3',5'-cyclic AMP phosphodiesterase CpdA
MSSEETAALKLIHMSDIHLTAPGTSIAGRDPQANFEKALSCIVADHADSALMVITGDLSDWGDLDDYRRLKACLEAFPVNTRLCIGNHDNRARFLEVFPELADQNGFVQSSYDFPAGRCLFLDTSEPGTHAGRYCSRRQAWLHDRLQEHDGPFFIFMHHNPIPTHLQPLDQIRLLDDHAFRAVVGSHRTKVRHIFFGHCHMPLAGSTNGVPTTSLRGTNHAGYALFREKTLISGSDLPQSFGVAFVTASYVTVHMVEFGYEGPFWIESNRIPVLRGG